MYGVVMHNTIKTLLEKGKSQRAIARELKISRKVVRRIKTELEEKHSPGRYHREKQLSAYEEQIKTYLDSDLSAVLIHQRLQDKHGLQVSYSTVRRFVAGLKSQEAYVPIQTGIGEEAQVDFGYLGKFQQEDGSWVKVWVFNMLLSYSRYAYYEIVTDQSVPTFIRCHIHAFEFFGGVTEWVLLDNLKAGVIHPNFYEPVLQEQYSEFLAHYSCAGKPCRVRKPEHKGKVESGIKYLKNNFVKGLEHRSFKRLIHDLDRWVNDVCNKRTHGTTRKVPAQVFNQLEKPKLQSLPPKRYEIWQWEQRKVNRMGHITFRYSYYSVPYQYIGQQLRIQSNGTLIKILDGQKEVALHQLSTQKGQYVTRPEHLPAHKQPKGPDYYKAKLEQIGPSAVALMQTFVKEQPKHWKEKTQGLLNLRKTHSDTIIEQACQRALSFGAYTYLSVKNICDKGLIEEPPAQALPEQLGGFTHDLASYDQLIPSS
jgi:transposase